MRITPGPGCWVAKLDLVKYFVALAASPALQQLLWFSDPRFEAEWRGRGASCGPPPNPRQWKHRREGRYRHFLTCIFGIKVLPAYANMLSGEICRVLRMLGCHLVTFLTDDFLIVARTREECERHVQTALELFVLLGLESVAEKNEGPAPMLDFLGIDVDARGELRVSWKRLDRLALQLLHLVRHDVADREDTRSVAGLLSWLSLYLRGASTFVRSSWDVANSGDGVSADVAVSPAFRADVAWWLWSISTRTLSGSRLLLHGCALQPLHVKSDGSGSGRYGFWCVDASGHGVLVWGGLPLEANVHVPYVELFAVFICCMMFGASWSSRLISFGVDSAPVCDALNKGSSPNSPLSLLLRYIAMLQVRYRFDFVARHVTRGENKLADIVTRHSSVQEVLPYLEHEGFSAAACEATPRRCLWRSPLPSSGICALSLGRRRRSRSSCRRKTASRL